MREIETSNGIARIVETGSPEKGSRIIETNLPNIRGSFRERQQLRAIFILHARLPSIISTLLSPFFAPHYYLPLPRSNRENERISREGIVEIDGSRNASRAEERDESLGSRLSLLRTKLAKALRARLMGRLRWREKGGRGERLGGEERRGGSDTFGHSREEEEEEEERENVTITI